MSKLKLVLLAILCLSVGLYIGTAIEIPFSLSQSEKHDDSEVKPAEKEILYWVAPMDDNYRRDKPGKSPMGMDLVPVYADDGGEEQAGTVKIDADMVNNLGVRTTKAYIQPVVSQIKTVGYIEYNQDSVIHIHPRVSGWVDKLYVKSSGETVTKGQPIYALYSPELVNAQEELIIALQRSNKALIKAAGDRLHALEIPSNTIQKLKRDKKVNQVITFYAQQDGVVDSLVIREGFYVKPGNNIMSIASLEQIWVNVEIFPQQAEFVQLGTAVTMTLDYFPARKWFGEVDFIYPALDPSTRAVNVRLRFSNDDALLKPNMFADLVLHTKNSPVLAVPSEAVIRTGSQKRVVVALGDGKFKSVEVYTGTTSQQLTQIVAGIEEGAEVVTSAQFLLDSESSKTSDFVRMYHDGSAMARIAQTSGIINAIDETNRVANISRGAIEKWNRGPATMDFLMDDSINISRLQPGMHIELVFKIDDSGFVITYIKPIMASDNTNKQANSVVN